MAFELHGVETKIIEKAAQPITINSQSIIGIVGTAGKGAQNTLTLVTSLADAANKFGSYKNDGFTLPEHLKAIFEQTKAVVIAVNVVDVENDTASITDEDIAFSPMVATLDKGYITDLTLHDFAVTKKFDSNGNINLNTGLTISAVKSSDGVTTYAVTDDYTFSGGVLARVSNGDIAAGATVLIEYSATLVEGTDYEVNAEDGTITILSGSKIIRNSTAQADYTHVDHSGITGTDVLGGANGEGDYTGAYKWLDACNELGYKPKIICAPGWTHQKPGSTANAVATGLLVLADKLGAIAILDTPDNTYEKAVEYRQDFESDRAYIMYPHGKIVAPDGTVVTSPLSGRIAGVFAKSDADGNKGFWSSPSNTTINGIVGLSKPIDFSLDDRTSRANLLNGNHITTVVRTGGGFRLWGNRVAISTGSFQFINVRRIADSIADALLTSHLWAVDRNLSANLVELIIENVNKFLRHMKAIGAIYGGSARVDSEVNTAETLADGKLYVDVDFDAPSPAEHIQFRLEINNNYTADIIN